MISCPWCGTNYAAFQSNCKNCGGPLQPAPYTTEAVISPSFSQEALVAPPPAPRKIDPRYAWKLMLSESLGIAGLVFGLLGGIFSVLGLGLILGVITAFVGLPFLFIGVVFLAVGAGLLIWRYQEAQKTINVMKWGQAVRGEVTQVQENYNVTVNNRHPWTIHYHYNVLGRSYTGYINTLNAPTAQMQPARPVFVLYLPDAPKQNALYPRP